MCEAAVGGGGGGHVAGAGEFEADWMWDDEASSEAGLKEKDLYYYHVHVR